jgi:hypothetical protein
LCVRKIPAGVSKLTFTSASGPTASTTDTASVCITLGRLPLGVRELRSAQSAILQSFLIHIASISQLDGLRRQGLVGLLRQAGGSQQVLADEALEGDALGGQSSGLHVDLVEHRLEGVGFVDGQLSENLTVEVEGGGGEGVDEARVGEVEVLGGCRDGHDPVPPEVAGPQLAPDVSLLEALLDSGDGEGDAVLGTAVEALCQPEVLLLAEASHN